MPHSQIKTKFVFSALAVFACFLSSFLANAQQDQPSRSDAEQSFKNILSKFISEKSVRQFLVITPTDIADILRNDHSANIADPCETASRIEFGQAINGELTNTDCRLDDGSYADFYDFDAVAGETAHVVMGSGTFITYVGVANESGTFVVEGLSPLDVVLPETGRYIILANSLEPNQFGVYSLKLTGGPNCTFSFDPPSAEVPAEGGNFSFQVITQPRCYWIGSTVGFGSAVTASGSGVGNGTVNYSVIPNTINQERYLGVWIRDTALFNILQAARACPYVLNPTSVNVGPNATSGTFTVTAPTGCFWSASNVGSFLQISSGINGNGNGMVRYTVENNNGADRSGIIRVGDQMTTQDFTVNQTGRNCSYSVTPSMTVFPFTGGSGNYAINTQPGCTWFLNRNQLWIEMQVGSGSGPATRSFHVQPTVERHVRSAAIDLSWAADETSHYIITYIDQDARLLPTMSDFDGDGQTDISVFRPSTGAWYLQRSQTGFSGRMFGLSDDKITPADFDGDNKTDIAVYRPSTGTWYVLNSGSGTVSYYRFGLSEDLPTPADYDGDGKADISVFRPSTGSWYRQNSGNGSFFAIQFGTSEDKPTIGDFDGDGKADIAVFRPSTGAWYRINSSDNSIHGENFGFGSDVLAPADYDGDGKTDIAVYRPSTGIWYLHNSADSSFTYKVFGLASDIPAPADFDGDGKADITVFRPSDGTWYRQNSSNGQFVAVQFGTNGDKPTQTAFRY
jgi:hypothetical protein